MMHFLSHMHAEGGGEAGHAAHVFGHAVIITGFVFVMMLVVEYLNVVTRGRWKMRLSDRGYLQYAVAAFLGVTPGCLGAFAVVALYAHRTVSIGALVAAMVATSGDESFVMLSMFPLKAIVLFGLLFVLGIVAGVLTDVLAGKRLTAALPCETELEVHEEHACGMLCHGGIVQQWRHCTPIRGLMSVGLGLFLVATVLGYIGPHEWGWERISVVLAALVGLLIVATVPEHFLEEHLWRHVAIKHAPRIFLWTLGALAVMTVLLEHFDVKAFVEAHRNVVLAAACLIGIIPESGPHLLFVTLYSKGQVPFSVLAASSIVQDGHGMLPLLAHSLRAFIVVKAINFAFGMAAGVLMGVFGI